MKYCIQTIHRKNGNKYLFAGFKKKGDSLIPVNHFYLKHQRLKDDVCIFPNIFAACSAVRNIDDVIWRCIIRPYPISFLRFDSVSSRREVTPDD